MANQELQDSFLSCKYRKFYVGYFPERNYLIIQNGNTVKLHLFNRLQTLIMSV